MMNTIPITLCYSVVSSTVPHGTSKTRVAQLVAEAAKRWNKVMRGYVYLATSKRVADIILKFGTVDRSEQKDRVAQCKRTRDASGVVKWEITFADDVTWDTSAWWQFWKGGKENLLCGIMHELGHVWLNPPHESRWHSDIPGDVMAPSLLNSVISNDEAARYRDRYQLLNND